MENNIEQRPFIIINGRQVGPGFPVYIVAEMGINYNGSIHTAVRMVEAARAARVDALKFQIITAGRCYTRESTSYSLFRSVEMPKRHWIQLIDMVRNFGMDVLATFADARDLADYDEIRWPAYKISSSNLVNMVLIEAVASRLKPVILSTGMGDMAEVHSAEYFLRQRGVNDIALLQCTSIYPVPPEAMNLRVITSLAREFPSCPIGLSDHSLGITCAIAAVALDAVIIEKHFTLDRNLPGPDHHFSSTPEELFALVRDIRIIEKALGSGIKAPMLSEANDRMKYRRVLVALRNLKTGTILSGEDIAPKRAHRPGIPVDKLTTILGRKLEKDISADEPLTFDMLAL